MTFSDADQGEVDTVARVRKIAPDVLCSSEEGAFPNSSRRLRFKQFEVLLADQTRPGRGEGPLKTALDNISCPFLFLVGLVCYVLGFVWLTGDMWKGGQGGWPVRFASAQDESDPIELQQDDFGDEVQGTPDSELDKTDADLTERERRTRFHVCMEHVSTKKRRDQADIWGLIAQLSDRLSEADARNYVTHSLLVNCYHQITQEQVEVFGKEILSDLDLDKLLSRPEDGSVDIRLSAKQNELLDRILREKNQGVGFTLGGKDLSELPRSAEVGLIVVGLLLLLVLPSAVVHKLLWKSDSEKTGSKKTKKLASAERKKYT